MPITKEKGDAVRTRRIDSRTLKIRFLNLRVGLGKFGLKNCEQSKTEML